MKQLLHNEKETYKVLFFPSPVPITDFKLIQTGHKYWDVEITYAPNDNGDIVTMVMDSFVGSEVHTLQQVIKRFSVHLRIR